MRLEGDSPRNFSQVGTAAAGVCHRDSRIIVAGHFKHERSAESDFYQITQKLLPIDFSVARRQMIVVGAAIVMSVNHSEMTGKFVDEVMDVASQISVTCIEAHADFGGIDSIQNPQNVARVPEKQMRQFVFQDAHDSDFLAAPGDLVQRFDYVLHARQLFSR